VAVAESVPDVLTGGRDAIPASRDDLTSFRRSFYDCLTARADALFELTDAVLCAGGPVTSLVELSLVAEHRRGHGALYDSLACGGIDPVRLRRSLTEWPVPRAADGRIILSVDVSAWLRPDAATSPDRLFCHVYGRGRGQAQMIPGWPYSFVAALEPGRSSWTALLDAVRLGPTQDLTLLTAEQIREMINRLRAAGQWCEGDPDILIVFDAGYDVTRLAFLLADLPVELLGRLRSDRVFRFPAPPRAPGTTGRPPKHGPEFVLSQPATHPRPAVRTSTETTRYGTAVAYAWNRLHPRLTHRAAWAEHDGPLPVITGSIIRLIVERLPGDRHPKPVWLWCSRPELTATDVDRLWQAFLRRFDIEHTFRFLKQTLGWTRPRLRTPRRRIAGPGSSSPPIPNSGWPATSPKTCAVPGRNPPHDPGDSLPRESVGGFVTSDPPQPYQPAHQNPHDPVQGDPPDPRTNAPPHTMTSARTPPRSPTSPKTTNQGVKQQA
jgi:hypothetical protein